MEASAEVDDEAQLRTAFRRYASGLSAYSRKAKAENLAAIVGMRHHRERICKWLAEASVSTFTDAETGLLNRTAAQRRMETEIAKEKPFCAIVVSWTEDSTLSEKWKATGTGQIVKELADRLAATIRPYDVIFRWSQDQLVTIFSAAESDIASRTNQIAGWLGDASYSIEVNGEPLIVKAQTAVSLVEHISGESVDKMIGRIDSVASRQLAAQ